MHLMPGTFKFTAGEIIYQDVHFAYNNAEEVIDGLNLHIESGKTVALVGPSGGGKSTNLRFIATILRCEKWQHYH